MNEDTNSILKVFLDNQMVLSDLVSDRIHCPAVPENGTLPAVSFLTRGGTNDPYIKGMVEPSVQFDCWADDPIEARSIYRALYDVLQGIQREVVTVDGTDYIIWSAIEEVMGQDLQDVDIPNYYRVMAFFRFMIKAV